METGVRAMGSKLRFINLTSIARDTQRDKSCLNCNARGQFKEGIKIRGCLRLRVELKMGGRIVLNVSWEKGEGTGVLFAWYKNDRNDRIICVWVDCVPGSIIFGDSHERIIIKIFTLDGLDENANIETRGGGKPGERERRGKM